MSQGAEARGFVFWDIDSNGILDAFDIPLQNQYVSYSSENNLAITNSNGLFRSFPPSGNQNIYYQVPNYFTITTSNPQNLNVQLNTIDTVYFGIQSLSSINDLKVEIHAFTLPRPGFSRNYMIQYKNIGTNNLNNAKLKFLKSDDDVIVSATGNYTLVGDTIIWDIGSLSPFNNGQYTVETTLSTSAIFGEYIQTQAWIEPSVDDFNQTNNHATISELVVSSCDPNDKTVLPETSLPFENIKLEYIIRFQNTGNYQADFVIVKDTLDQYLDINTLEMVGASHNYELQIENRIATWNFSEINLPDSLSDEPNSHGFIKFKINKSQGLPAGTEIPNRVAIYFDYNSPIITNTCIFSIQEPLINDDAGNSIGAVAFPIPSSNLVQLTIDKTLTNTELTLTNLVGQIIFRSNFETLSNIEFYLPEATGIYFLTIKTEEEIKVLRLIKE